MIGAAVAVARGNLPLDFVSASLCAPARTALPLAPSEVISSALLHLLLCLCGPNWSGVFAAYRGGVVAAQVAFNEHWSQALTVDTT